MTPNVLFSYGDRPGGRQENQDSSLITETSFGVLAVVCDGMGGGPAGKTASSLAVTAFCKVFSEGDDDCGNLMQKAVAEANYAVYQSGISNPSLHGMGTTLVAALFARDGAYVVNVGDSRAYQLRFGHVAFKTDDHSLVADAVRHGQLTEEQARLDSQSNVITKALGLHPELTPNFYFVPYERSDRFVLCTDGIWGMLKQSDLIDLIKKYKSPQSAVRGILEIVDNLGKKSGGHHDNMTVAVIDIKKDSITRTKMNRRSLILILSILLCFVVTVCMLLFGQKRRNSLIEKDYQEKIAIIEAKNAELDSLLKDRELIISSLKDQLAESGSSSINNQ